MVCLGDTFLEVGHVNFFFEVFVKAGETGGFRSHLSNDCFLFFEALFPFLEGIGCDMCLWGAFVALFPFHGNVWSDLLSLPTPGSLVVLPFSYQHF